jgi:hypothetical protein
MGSNRKWRDLKWHDRKSRDRKWRQSRDRKWPYPEVYYAHAEPEVGHIRPSGAFWPEMTKSRDRKRPCPEVSLTEVGSAHARLFPRVFFLIVEPDVTKGHLTPFGVPFECTQPEVVQHL